MSKFVPTMPPCDACGSTRTKRKTPKPKHTIWWFCVICGHEFAPGTLDHLP